MKVGSLISNSFNPLFFSVDEHFVLPNEALLSFVIN